MARDRKPKRTIQERFDEFHEKHPEVFSLFERFTRELVSAGWDRGGAKSIFERIRWEYAVNPEFDEGFKLNNVFSSRYSRLLMGTFPQFRGFFETRKLKS